MWAMFENKKKLVCCDGKLYQVWRSTSDFPGVSHKPIKMVIYWLWGTITITQATLTWSPSYRAIHCLSGINMPHQWMFMVFQDWKRLRVLDQGWGGWRRVSGLWHGKWEVYTCSRAWYWSWNSRRHNLLVLSGQQELNILVELYVYEG
jgi:hypothetical protein